MAKTKGLTRPIKRSQATAYDVIANANPPRGVTHLLELNARGAYERHYVQAREFLDNEGRMYTAKQKSAMRKMSPKRRAVFKKMLAKSPGLPTRRARSNKKKKRAPRRTTAMKTGLRRAKATPA